MWYNVRKAMSSAKHFRGRTAGKIIWRTKSDKALLLRRIGRMESVMRTIGVAIIFLFYTIAGIVLHPAMFIIGKCKGPEAKAKASQKLVAGVFKVFLFVSGVKIDVIGVERVPRDQASLFVFNHRGYFDILLGYSTVPVPSAFVAKKEMEHTPVVARWMRYMHCLFLDRENMKEGMKTILEGVKLLKNGHSVFIAPEGTRNHGKELLPFKEGSFMMAEKAKSPIVPVAMNNTDDVLENHAPWIHKTHVVIEYCEPIYVAELSKEEKKELSVKVRSIIASTLEKNAVEP